MTATQYDRSAVARPAPVPAPARSPRPPLRVVEGDPTPRPVDRRRRARLRVAVTMVVVVGGLFGLVASHVVLTQGQFRLQQVESRAQEAQARYERLRLQVAALESPERIVAAAQERLGMVPPPGVKYLSPTGVAEQPPGSPGAGATAKGQGAAAGPEDWSAVKRHLESQP